MDYRAYAQPLVLGFGALLFLALTLALWYLIRPNRPGPEKLTTYECGEEPVGEAWVQLPVHYYLYALFFVVFDVEAVYLFPWALKYRDYLFVGLGPFAVMEAFVFIGILGLGLYYVWRKGALEWQG